MSPPLDVQEPSTFDSAKTDPDWGARPQVDRRRSRVGRFTLLQPIGSDAIGTVYLARIAGPAAQAQVAAIKQLHPHLARDPDFSSVFIDQATLASRVRHRNVLPLLEVVIEGPDIFLVMEQVDGAGLAALVRAAGARQRAIPLPIAVALAIDVLQGVHAAHEARTRTGAPLQILHRSVCPQNVLVGVDGVARLFDIGLAKAWNASRAGQRPRAAQDSCYLAPEQIRQELLTRAADIFSASALFWELVTSQPLFTGTGELERMVGVLDRRGLRAPSSVAAHVPEPLDRIILKGLAEDLQRRYPTALAMAEAIERVVRPASQRQVSQWVQETAGSGLFRSAALLEDKTAVDRTAPPRVRSVPPPPRPRPVQVNRWRGHLQKVRGRIADVGGRIADVGGHLRGRVPTDRRAVLGAAAGALLLAITLIARWSSHHPTAVQAELALPPSNAVIEPLVQPEPAAPEPVIAPEPIPEAPPPPPALAVAVATAAVPEAPVPPAEPSPATEETATAAAEPAVRAARDLPAKQGLRRASLPPLPPYPRARTRSPAVQLESEPEPEPIEPEVSLVETGRPGAPVATDSETSAILNEPASPTPDTAKQRRKRAPLVTENRRVPLLE
jgi:serine/threonine-protein kinase